jgi:hypothetical protein
MSRSVSGADGTWTASSISSNPATEAAVRGDGSIFMLCGGGGQTTVYTSTNGDTLTTLTSRHTLYGGSTSDTYSRIKPHPTDNTKFLIVGNRSSANDQALILETQDGTTVTRHPTAPTSSSLTDIVWWPAQNLWVASMLNGDVQVASALAGPWVVRATGNTQRIDRLLVDGPTLYGLGASGRLITTTDAQAFVLSVFDPRINTVRGFQKVGSTFVILAQSTALDGLGRIIVSDDMINPRSRIYSDGTQPNAPDGLVIADNRIFFFEGDRPVFSQSLDFNPSLQFVAPDLRAGNTVQAEWFIKT